MSALVLGVVVDILIHVLIQLRYRVVVSGITSAVWFFAVLDSSEFVVLNPEIRLEYLGCGCEPEQGGIAWR